METCKLVPSVKETLWAGDKLSKYGKKSQDGRIAECWELSFHNDGPCSISSGPYSGRFLKDEATEKDIGTYASSFPFFPVLIKLIDAGKDLSVQVHPSDDYALKNENSFGKTEMWHVLSVDEGCGLYVGLKKDTSKEEIQKALNEGTILSLLNFFKVRPGENYFIPSGTIHAIGKGVTLIEIQQNSNLTYRLYDYNRVDKDGHRRPLHIQKALAVIDCSKYEPICFKGNVIGSCKYFTSWVYKVSAKPEIASDSSSFSSLTFLYGKGEVNGIPYKTYDTFFIPAGQKASIKGEGEYVLTSVLKNWSSLA